MRLTVTARPQVVTASAWTSASSAHSRSSTRAAVPRLRGASRARCSRCCCSMRTRFYATDRLIGPLWGERAQAQAPRDAADAHLASAQGAGGLGLKRPRQPDRHARARYELALDPEQLDSHRFERLLARGRAELAGDRADSAVRAFEEALALWRGDPLADLAYEPFALPEIARLDDLRSATLEQLMEAKLTLGGHAEVVEQLEVLIGEHPYRERLRAQLMLALYRSDRQADALQAYQDARRPSSRSWGSSRGSGLRELDSAMLARIPRSPRGTRRAEGGRGRARADAGPRRVFVGRAAELAELVAGLDGALDGHGRLILLAGEPGIGKSRLADALAEQARARGARSRRPLLGGRRRAGLLAVDPGAPRLHRRYRVGRAASAAGRRCRGSRSAPPRAARALPGLPRAARRSRGRARASASSRRCGPSSQAPPTPARSSGARRPARRRRALAPAPSVRRARAGCSRLLVVGAYRDVDPTLRDALTAALGELVREAHTAHLALRGLTRQSGGVRGLSTAIEPARASSRPSTPRRRATRSSSRRSCTCSPRKAAWRRPTRPCASRRGSVP